MIVEAQVVIHGSRAAIWAAITDIENAAQVISGWRETRLLFDKPTAVEKWITEAVTPEFYRTRAESDGFAFLTTLSLAEGGGGVTLTSSHESRPQSLVARFLKVPMIFLFRGVMRKVIRQDLEDFKAAVEKA